MPVKTIEREPEPQPLPGENPVSSGIGHNRPPVEETVAIEFKEELLRERPQFLSRLDEMIAAADRVEIVDDETLGKAGDLAKMHRAAAHHIDEAHRTVKAPYLAGGRAVDAEKNTLLGRLEPAQRLVQGRMNEFTARREAERRAEQERIAAEQRAAAERAAEAERARERAEAEARAAAQNAANEDERRAAEERARIAAEEAEQAMADAALAPASAKTTEPVRSDAGSTVSTKQVWNSEVQDIAKAFKAVKSDPKVKEAVEQAVARLVRAGQREIAGVRVWPTTQAIAR